MSESKITIEVKVERTIPAPLNEVFDAWLNPQIPGNPWNMLEKLLLNPHVDGFFCWCIKGAPHYVRFTELERPDRIQHTWMSPNTSGLESMVTLTFEKQGDDTRVRNAFSPDSASLHSTRNARSGSRLAARLAGIALATRATTATPATASKYVTGSRG